MDYYELCCELIREVVSNGETHLGFSEYIIDRTGRSYSEITSEWSAIETEAKRACINEGINPKFIPNSNGLIIAIIL